jgi:hypothetical protein
MSQEVVEEVREGGRTRISNSPFLRMLKKLMAIAAVSLKFTD